MWRHIMAKRGRPPKPEEYSGVHKKKYYKTSQKREDNHVNKNREEKVLNAYDYIYNKAFDLNLSTRYKTILAERLRDMGILL